MVTGPFFWKQGRKGAGDAGSKDTLCAPCAPASLRQKQDQNVRKRVLARLPLRPMWGLLLCGVWFLAGCATAVLGLGDASPTAEPSPTPSPTPTATATWPPTITPSPIPPTTAAPQFYVSLDGDDRLGDGSRGRPWATISYAVRHVPDGALIWVAPGVYHGRVDLVGRFPTGITIRAERPYQAALRHTDTVVTAFYAQGITLEGFDIAHTDPGATFYVVQIQDFLRQQPDDTGTTSHTSRITLRNNILHDSYGRDLLKINNGARNITIEGNLFYNQGPHSHQIDVNSAADVLIQDNLFLNQYEASGRDNHNDSHSFVAVKDGNGAQDSLVASQRIILRRNVFMHWQGHTGSHFLSLGEETSIYYQAREILVENNLFIGNSPHPMLAPWGVKGALDVTFQHNTITGELPAFAGVVRFNTAANNPPNERIAFYNNLWHNPTGTLGQANPTDPPRLVLGQAHHVGEVVWANNLFWNGGVGIPADGLPIAAPRLIGDPLLPLPTPARLPYWLPNERRFTSHNQTIEALRTTVIAQYGLPEPAGAGVGTADARWTPNEDILGRPRPHTTPAIGAAEPRD